LIRDAPGTRKERKVADIRGKAGNGIKRHTRVLCWGGKHANGSAQTEIQPVTTGGGVSAPDPSSTQLSRHRIEIGPAGTSSATNRPRSSADTVRTVAPYRISTEAGWRGSSCPISRRVAPVGVTDSSIVSPLARNESCRHDDALRTPRAATEGDATKGDVSESKVSEATSCVPTVSHAVRGAVTRLFLPET
jgi:hypothetical protein